MSELKCEICNNDICLNNTTEKPLRLCLIDTIGRICPKCGFNRARILYFPAGGDSTGMVECWLCQYRW